MSHDPMIEKAEGAELDAERARRAASLFDLRKIIGGLFAVYGVILVILGIGASDAEIDKAAGWNLNLWVGIAMLVVAALFMFWAFTRPLAEELDETERDGGSEPAGGRPRSDGH